MPPQIRFTKDQILDAAVDLVRVQGAASLNARAIAKKLGCSTRPLFRDFQGMEEIRQAVILRATDVYNRYIEESKKHIENPYKKAGLAYLCFAKEEKELFKLLFMRDRSGEKTEQTVPDKNLDYIVGLIVDKTGLTPEKALDFHWHMWFYSHGLAVMIATDYLSFTEKELEKFLSDEFSALIGRYKNGDEHH